MTTVIRRHVPDGFGPTVATLTVTSRRVLTSPEVVGVLVAAARTPSGTVRIGTDLTRAQADQLIEGELLRRGGNALHGWDVGLNEDDLRDAVRWAAEQIRRAWPALGDTALAALVAAHAPPLLHTLRSDDPPALQ